MDKVDIIYRIGYIRTRAKLTQKGLSRAIEMNDNYINRLESKKDFLPSVEVLLKIIEACGSTPEEFFYHDITAYRSDMEFGEKYQALSPDIKKFVTDYDSELMSLFVKLNEKAMRLNQRAAKPSDN